MPELAYVNGTFGPIGEAMVSIEDRGFQFGDGVYEVIVAYAGRLFLLVPHMQRLRRSASAIGIDYDFDGQPLEPVIEEGFRRSGFRDAMVYIQLTRGVAPRIHVPPDGLRPTVVMTFKPLPLLPDGLRSRGARVITTPDTRWSKCYVKAVTLLPNVLAKCEAISRGFDDAIFIADNGEVRECTSSNVFIVRGGKLQFPPRNESILHGVTQGFLIDCADSIGLVVEEKAFDLDTMRTSDEVFMSGTTVEALGITTIDSRPVADGKVGPITQRLYVEFNKRVQTSTSRNGEKAK